MQQYITDTILKTMVDILVPVVLLGVFALLSRAWQWMRLKMSADQLTIVDFVIRKFVLAAEQYSLEGEIGQEGEEKFRWAMDRIEAALKQRGITIELDEITDYIVARVHEEFNKLPPISAITVQTDNDLGIDSDALLDDLQGDLD